MSTEGEEELLTYTQSIGVPHRWFQNDGHQVPHFDLTGKFMRIVQADPIVVKLDRVDWVDAYRWVKSQQRIKPRATV